MSDAMLFGVLGMPYEVAMSTELSRLQFHDRAQQACDTIEALQAERDALKAALEVSQAATNAAVSKAQFQASTNAELNALHAEVRRLKAEACKRFNDEFGCDAERDAQRSAAEQARVPLLTDEAALEALAELVALKDMKDEESSMRQRRECSILRRPNKLYQANALRAEYNRRKPQAWAAARAVLATTQGSKT